MLHSFRALALILFAFIAIAMDSSQGGEPKSFDIPLWENGAPGALGTESKDIPMAMVRLPASESAVGMLVICPGGGYGNLAMDHEGHQIAAWANEMGLAALICDYRHRGKGYGHPAPSDDAKRAIRLARANAKEWNIDLNRVGLMGFSAGGHLASTVLTQYDEGDPTSPDLVAKQSSRPNFGILCYPVIMFGSPESHKGSEKNLLGPSPDPQLMKSLANHERVTPNTPPTFLMHTFADTVVPVENAISFYSAMVKNKVPGELHVYELGHHGIGLGTKFPAASDWPQACKRWLKTRQIVQ